jgi:hypothetical protein
LALTCLPAFGGEDRGDLIGGQAVQVQVPVGLGLAGGELGSAGGIELAWSSVMACRDLTTSRSSAIEAGTVR